MNGVEMNSVEMHEHLYFALFENLLIKATII